MTDEKRIERGRIACFAEKQKRSQVSSLSYQEVSWHAC